METKHNSNFLQEILIKYTEGTATPEELDFLDQWDHYINQHHNSFEELSDAEKQNTRLVLLNKLLQEQPVQSSKIRRLRRYWPVAASLLLLVSVVALMYFAQRDKQPNTELVVQHGEDILPGKNQAYITLSDGSQLALSGLQEGIVVDEAGIRYDDGSLIQGAEAISNAVIHVPRAGTYRITLSDGTKVVLNSGSSLQYPTRFAGAERKVLLEGEGYFEVASQLDKPFIVVSGQQELKVLGTHFNVKAYANEPLITTLVEGSVALQTKDNSIKLIPGQQAIFDRQDYRVQQVEVTDFTAWTRELFVFNMVPLRDVFKQMERWYDVDFEYPASLGDEKYFMEIPKDRKLSEVLSSLAVLTGITFKIEERRVQVQR